MTSYETIQYIGNSIAWAWLGLSMGWLAWGRERKQHHDRKGKWHD